MVAQAEVVVIGEGRETLAAGGGVLASLVDGHEEWVVLHQVIAAGEPQALLGVVGEVLLSVHGDRNLRWVADRAATAR